MLCLGGGGGRGASWLAIDSKWVRFWVLELSGYGCVQYAVCIVYRVTGVVWLN